MGVKEIFQNQFRQHRAVIARQILKQAFRSGLPGHNTMGEILAELEEDESLWEEFGSLTLSTLREMLVQSQAEFGAPPGPTRKRGVTSGRIVAFVRENPGARRADIMKALGLKGGTISSQLRTLRATGKLRSTGPERSLQYYAP